MTLLRRLTAGPAHEPPRVRLICVPHAGAGASVFQPWVSVLPDGVDALAVQLPGREDRLSEPPAASLRAVVAELAEEVPSDVPLVLFGHSMGALVAWELARLLWARGGRQPRHLVVSGCPAPAGFAAAARDRPPLDAAALLDELRELGGVSAQPLADADLAALFLPAAHADYTLVREHRVVDGPAPGCALTAVAGEEDQRVPLDALLDWADTTSGRFSARTVPGGHLYLLDRPAPLVDLLRALVTAPGR